MPYTLKIMINPELCLTLALRKGIGMAMTAVFDNDAAIEALEPLIGYDFGGEINGLLKASLDMFMGYDIEGAKSVLRRITDNHME